MGISVAHDTIRTDETPHSLLALISLTASFTALILSSLNDRCPLLILSATDSVSLNFCTRLSSTLTVHEALHRLLVSVLNLQMGDVAQLFVE